MRFPIVQVLMLCGALILAAPAHADGPAIRTTIDNQLEAFQRSDVREAFTYASPMIQMMFGSAERFGQMVETGYPMVWRFSEYRFGTLQERNGRFVQPVFLRDSIGRAYIAQYDMIEVDGLWRINGVMIEQAAGVGA